MRARARLVAVVGAASCIVAGCSGSTDTQDRSADGSSGDAASSASVAGSPEVPEPERGTCWSVPAASVVDQEYWFDDSVPVPCTQPHTTETAVVLDLGEATVEEATVRGRDCWNHVRLYLGIDAESWVPWSPVAFLPSEAEVAAGATWLRCDAMFPETTQVTGVRTTSVSAAGLADDPPADFWGCIDRPPPGADQPFVPCDRPHRYEETGILAYIGGITEYPPEAELAAEAEEQCSPSVPPGYGDVSMDALWDEPSALDSNTEIFGVCFVHRTDGELLPARQTG